MAHPIHPSLHWVAYLHPSPTCALTAFRDFLFPPTLCQSYGDKCGPTNEAMTLNKRFLYYSHSVWPQFQDMVKLSCFFLILTYHRHTILHGQSNNPSLYNVTVVLCFGNARIRIIIIPATTTPASGTLMEMEKLILAKVCTTAWPRRNVISSVAHKEMPRRDKRGTEAHPLAH